MAYPVELLAYATVQSSGTVTAQGGFASIVRTGPGVYLCTLAPEVVPGDEVEISISPRGGFAGGAQKISDAAFLVLTADSTGSKDAAWDCQVWRSPVPAVVVVPPLAPVAVWAPGGGVGLSTEVYVDPAGNDATGVRGNLGRPYATINAALLAAFAGDTIVIAGGTYTENVIMPDKDRMTLRGDGQQNTRIVAPGGLGAAFAWLPLVAGMHSLLVRDLRFETADGATAAVVLNGNGQGDFGDQRITFLDCAFSNTAGADSVRATQVNWLVLQGCFADFFVHYAEVSLGFFVDCVIGGADIGYSFTGAVPFSGRQEVAFTSSLVQGLGLVLRNAPAVIGDASSIVTGVVTGDNMQVYPGLGAPSFIWLGTLGDLTGFATAINWGGAPTTLLPAFEPATPTVVQLDQATVRGSLLLETAPALNPQPVRFRGGVFTPAGISSINYGGIGGSLVDLDMRGTSYPNQGVFNAGAGGTLDRDRWLLAGFGLFSGPPNVVPILPPYPLGTAPGGYQLVATLLTGGLSDNVICTGPKLDASCTVALNTTGSPAAIADLLFIRGG